MGDFLRPMLLRAPPARRLPAPGRPARAAARGRPRRRPEQARHPRLLPRDDDVGRRPARRLVRERRVQGRDGVDRRGRRVGRAAHARHRVQPAPPRARRDRRRAGPVGPREGRHGRDLEAIARSAEAVRRGRSATGAVGALDRRVRRSHGRRDARRAARSCARRSSSPARTRRRPCSSWRRAEHFPDEVVEDMRRYKTRGGSVKVNWVLSEPPRYEGVSRRGPGAAGALRRGVLPVDRLPRARLAGRLPRRARRTTPYLEVEMPSTIDSTLTDDGSVGDDDVHPVRAVARVRLAGRRARGVRRPLPGRSSPSARRTCATR